LGQGPNAVWSASALDKSTLMLESNSLMDYLSNHYKALKEDRY